MYLHNTSDVVKLLQLAESFEAARFLTHGCHTQARYYKCNETHIDNSILSSEILGRNYTIFRKDRNPNGGGVLTAVSNKVI